MEISHCIQPHQIDTTSEADFILGQAIIAGKPVTGCSCAIYTLYNRTPEKIDTDILDKLYQSSSSIQDKDSLIEFIKSIKTIGEEYPQYPIESVNEFLTYYINVYLKYVFGSKIEIDDAFLDIEDLLQIEEVTSNEGFGLMLNYFNKVFTINYKNKDIVKDIINNEVITSDNGTMLYQIPILTYKPLCGVIGFGEIYELKSYLENRNNEYIIVKENKIFNMLEDIRNSSPEFKEFGFIHIYARKKDSNKPFERFRRKVYYNTTGKYRIDFDS